MKATAPLSFVSTPRFGPSLLSSVTEFVNVGNIIPLEMSRDRSRIVSSELVTGMYGFSPISARYNARYMELDMVQLSPPKVVDNSTSQKPEDDHGVLASTPTGAAKMFGILQTLLMTP
jgi:hypothetical protein